MDAATLATVSAIWGIASGLAVAALGAACFLGGASRPRGAVAFGLFGLLLGAQVVVANLTKVVLDVDVAATLHLSYVALTLPLPFLLAEFAFAQSVGVSPSARRMARGVLVGSALTTALLLVARPTLILAGMQVELGVPFPVRGALYAPLVVFPFFATLAFAMVVLLAGTRASPTPRLASRSAVLLAGLGVYVAFAAANNLVFYVVTLALYESTFTDFALAATFSGLAALSLAIGLDAARQATLARPGEARRHRWLALAFLVPLGVGLVEGALAVTVLPFLDTVGLWRLAAVGIIVYGLAQWRLYDLPQRTARAAATAGGTAAAAVGGVAAYGAGNSLSGPVVAVGAAVLLVGAALVPSVRLARRIFRIDRVSTPSPAEDSLYGQRIDAYRAALEASLARDTVDEDEPFLAALRARFEITAAEDRVLRHYARASVVVKREHHAWDAYERLRLLGEGGAGRTWLARDRARDRLVVLKEPLERWQAHTGAKEMVLREARLAARVRHANVVAIEEVVEANGLPVIVMEYLDGGSLADRLRATGPLRPAEAIPVLLDVLAGVEAVHAAGIVHRDLKPSNILLAGDGTAKVADFGIATTAPSAGKTVVLEPAGVVGTMAYLAPEVRAGAPVDRRADVYACAVVLHECLHGAPPSVGLVRDDVPPALAALLARALADDPAQRPPTARAFADQLAKAVGG